MRVASAEVRISSSTCLGGTLEGGELGAEYRIDPGLLSCKQMRGMSETNIEVSAVFLK